MRLKFASFARFAKERLENGRFYNSEKRGYRSPQTGSFSGVHGTNGPQDPAGRPLDARRARPRLGVGAVGGGWVGGRAGGCGPAGGSLKRKYR